MFVTNVIFPRLPTNAVFRVDKPLYSISEAALHWYCTDHQYIQEELSMSDGMYDPYFLYTCHAMSPEQVASSGAWGFTCLQADDTACAGTSLFMKHKANILQRFNSKPVQSLISRGMMSWYGMDIQIQGNNYGISYRDHINWLMKIPDKNVYTKRIHHTSCTWGVHCCSLPSRSDF